MRFKFNESPKASPKAGSKRLVTKFAFLPKCIPGFGIIWLEKYDSHQVYLRTAYDLCEWLEYKVYINK
jgi:hypothetical protein